MFKTRSERRQWPTIACQVSPSEAVLTIAGVTTRWPAATLDDARQRLISTLQRLAEVFHRPLTVRAVEPDGQWTITVAPDGTISDGQARR